MKNTLNEMKEEASALGAVITDDKTFVFPSKNNANKFLYLHANQVTVEETKSNVVIRVKDLIE